MVSLLKYSNSWGHLFMSLLCISGGIVLMLLGDAQSKAVGTTMLLTTMGYWFISGARNAPTTTDKESDAINVH